MLKSLYGIPSCESLALRDKTWARTVYNPLLDKKAEDIKVHYKLEGCQVALFYIQHCQNELVNGSKGLEKKTDFQGGGINTGKVS